MEDLTLESAKCGYGGGIVHIFRDFALLDGCHVNILTRLGTMPTGQPLKEEGRRGCLGLLAIQCALLMQ